MTLEAHAKAHANRQPRVPAAAPISYALFRAGMMAYLSAFSASRRPDMLTVVSKPSLRKVQVSLPPRSSGWITASCPISSAGAVGSKRCAAPHLPKGGVIGESDDALRGSFHVSFRP